MPKGMHTMLSSTATVCMAVLYLPSLPAAMTTPCDAASMRKALMMAWQRLWQWTWKA